MRSAAITLSFVLALAAFGPASAAPADKHIELEADDGDTCAMEGKADCFRLANGTSLDGLEQGMRVHVVVENVGDNPHNLYVTQSENADDNSLDTSADDAINGTDTIDPGETTDLMVTVPSDANGLYLWCDVGSHEAFGMWLETGVSETSQEAENGGETNGTDDGSQTGEDGTPEDDDDAGDDVTRFLPAPGALVALVASLVGALVARRMR